MIVLKCKIDLERKQSCNIISICVIVIMVIVIYVNRWLNCFNVTLVKDAGNQAINSMENPFNPEKLRLMKVRV